MKHQATSKKHTSKLTAIAATAALYLLSVASAQAGQPAPVDGVLFNCSAPELDRVQADMASYLDSLGVEPGWYSAVRKDNALWYTLNTHPADTDTLNLIYRQEYKLSPETVELAKPGEKSMPRDTVSRKEIVLALMQHGRVTPFKAHACNAQAFIDHVALRQTTVAWTQTLAWGWPDGGPAKWNTALWKKGTPLELDNTVAAMRDVFTNQASYEIGCYTASKLAIVQGALDHFARAEPNTGKLAAVKARLMADNDPLVSVEPGRMWHFEADVTSEDMAREGKLLTLLDHVAPKNFVPGDWAYFLNPDPVSYAKTGYEGSNAIYLGGNRFDDYYADTPQGSYRYKEKLGEVYQWRNGVYSRSRDWAKRQPLTPEDYDKLGLPPEQGGLVLAYRAVPRYFGYEEPAAPVQLYAQARR